MSTNMPFTEGPITAKIAFIGEAPGREEDASPDKRPFIGESGRLLDEMAASVGIPRSACYYSNVIKERPPDNDITKFIDLSKKGHPASVQYGMYLKVLKEEIEELSANVLVAVGKTALYTLTGKTGITKYRGSILECTLVKGRKVIPIIHPAATWRQLYGNQMSTRKAIGSNFYYNITLSDLIRIKEDSNTPDLNLPKRNILLDPTFEQIIIFLRDIKGETAFDIETVRGEVSCISFAPNTTDAISIPFHHGLHNIWTPEEEAKIWLEIARVLEDETIIKIGQNLLFDTSFLFMKYGIRTWPFHDTMVAHGMLYPDLPKALDFITSTNSREPYYKDDGKQYMKIGGSDRDFWLYNAKDSLVVMDVWPALKEQMIEFGIYTHYLQKMKEARPAMYIQARGTKVDHEGLNEASKEAEDKITELTAQLYEQCGQEINPGSHKQMVEYFYIKKNIKPYLNRGTGKPSCDVEALKRLANGTESRAGLSEAQTILGIRHYSKLKSTYFEARFDEDGRRRGFMNIVGTGDDRWSSSETIFGTGGDRQNEPPAFKKFLGADYGYILYNIDLSKSHDNIIAYIAPDLGMQEALKADIHRTTASFIFQKPADQISDDPKSAKLGNGEFSERHWGKKANHALKYGMGYKSFAQLVEIKDKEARMIVESYHRAYPGVREYQEWIKRELKDSRTLTNPFGRKVLFLEVWSDALFRQAYAWIPLSTEAHIINQWGAVYIYENQDMFSKVELLNVVHDSIEFQIPKSLKPEHHAQILGLISANLTQPIMWKGIEFQMRVDGKIGTNFGNLEEFKIGKSPADIYKEITDKWKEW